MRGVSITGSLGLIAAGAILRYAITAHVSGVNIQTIGVILMIVGIVGLVLALVWLGVYVNQGQRPNGLDDRPRDLR